MHLVCTKHDCAQYAVTDGRRCPWRVSLSSEMCRPVLCSDEHSRRVTRFASATLCLCRWHPGSRLLAAHTLFRRVALWRCGLELEPQAPVVSVRPGIACARCSIQSFICRTLAAYTAYSRTRLDLLSAATRPLTCPPGSPPRGWLIGLPHIRSLVISPSAFPPPSLPPSRISSFVLRAFALSRCTTLY